MNQIIYRQGDLFKNVGNTTALVLSVNAQGALFGPIAERFAQLFPSAIADYSALCLEYKAKRLSKALVGRSLLLGYPTEKQRVYGLYSANRWGKYKDEDRLILENTEASVRDLLRQIPASVAIHSSRINEELMGIAWQDTAKAIERALASYPSHTWTVWE